MDIVQRAKYCLDTHAIMEIFGQNPKHKDLVKSPFIIPDLALAELYGVLARIQSKEIAEEWCRRFELYSVPVPRDILIKAVELRRSKKSLNLSLTDAAGYCLAQHLELPFVTGDKAFKTLPGVDFRGAKA